MEYLKTRQHGHKTEQVADLKQSDRCDRCPAAASVVVGVPVITERDFQESPQIEDLPLLFCNHHFNQHEPALAAAGFKTYRKDA